MLRVIALRRDLGLSKTNIQRCWDNEYERDEADEFAIEVRMLLGRKGDRYTAYEAWVLSDLRMTSHVECVLENAEDYEPLQVASAKRTEASVKRVADRLAPDDLGRFRAWEATKEEVRNLWRMVFTGAPLPEDRRLRHLHAAIAARCVRSSIGKALADPQDPTRLWFKF